MPLTIIDRLLWGAAATFHLFIDPSKLREHKKTPTDPAWHFWNFWLLVCATIIFIIAIKIVRDRLEPQSAAETLDSADTGTTPMESARASRSPGSQRAGHRTPVMPEALDEVYAELGYGSRSEYLAGLYQDERAFADEEDH
jgi:hypothetical protein